MDRALEYEHLQSRAECQDFIMGDTLRDNCKNTIKCFRVEFEPYEKGATGDFSGAIRLSGSASPKKTK